MTESDPLIVQLCMGIEWSGGMSRPLNEMRGIDSGSGRGRGRSVISNRNPSGRIVFRKRFGDAVDSRYRADNDDCFEGPLCILVGYLS